MIKINNAVTQMRSDALSSWENMWFCTITLIISSLISITSHFGGPSFEGMCAMTGLISLMYSIPTVYYWTKFINLIYNDNKA